MRRPSYFLVLFLVCLAIHPVMASVGRHHTLYDLAGYRQTQTAITSYYFLTEGFRMDYPVPVSGKPWTKPMEFPLYQGLVAAFSGLTGYPLDPSGRAVSLLFFYLSLPAVYFLLKQFIKNAGHRFAALSLFAASPFYLFWSRTFMIESLALCLSVYYLAGVVKTAAKPSLIIALLASAAGALSGLVKITTFLIFLPPAAALYLRFERNAGRLRDFFLLAAVPLALNAGWIAFADSQKLLNPLTSHATSLGLIQWNFGTWAQRLSPDTWTDFLRHSSRIFWDSPKDIFFIGFALALLLAGRYIRSYGKEILFGLLFFLAPNLVLTNLFSWHKYYVYANGFFLIFAVGLVITAVLENHEAPRWLKILLLPLLLTSMASAYFSYYYPLQKKNHREYNALVKTIRSQSREEDILLGYGFHGNPILPYYSQRRALMLPNHIPLTDPRFDQALLNLKDSRIAVVIIASGKIVSEPGSLDLLQKKLGKPLELVFHDRHADVYRVG
ncbi:MAG: glycosyltransferase family 39 protein [Candidatus Omnitrophica bacterium]|nr:glycosyltransferase family 39 protein [Candidatus Omnitrophota bacterium]